MNKSLPVIDSTWTLFLDRDGVINVDNIHGYILNWEEFKFYPGVLEAMATFAPLFHKIVLVTNQRGVGKGVMSKEDLTRIHDNMLREMIKNGGRMDAIYYCDATTNDHPNRKPNPGMAHEAKKQFPSIDFSKSIMVGNTSGDMEFGRAIGAYTVYIHTREDKIPRPETIDARFEDLLTFAKALHLG